MPGFPDKFAPFYKKPPGTTVSSTASRLVGSFVRPLRKITQRERNREPRWHDEVPSGWAREQGAATLTHRALEYFYYKFQYLRSERPGRQKAVEKYASGWITPAEAAYGDGYDELLPYQRHAIAGRRGLPRRPEIRTPQIDDDDVANGDD
jgi:hydrogenase small subunit